MKYVLTGETVSHKPDCYHTLVNLLLKIWNYIYVTNCWCLTALASSFIVSVPNGTKLWRTTCCKGETKAMITKIMKLPWNWNSQMFTYINPKPKTLSPAILHQWSSVFRCALWFANLIYTRYSSHWPLPPLCTLPCYPIAPCFSFSPRVVSALCSFRLLCQSAYNYALS